MDILPVRSASIANNELSREYQDKRARNDSQRNSGDPGLAFSKEEIAHEERKPKRKVAVMIGYSGSGYRGMQLYVPVANASVPFYLLAYVIEM